MDIDRLIKRAEAGDSEAQCELGWLYEQGRSLPQDSDKAVYWYRKSAEQGCENGRSELVRYCLSGCGTAFAWDKVVCWCTKALEAGLGCVEELEEWYQPVRLALDGDADAQKMLADRYLDEGLDTIIFAPQYAFYWYTKAAQQDHIGAQRALLRCYLNGIGTEPSDEQALYWQRRLEDNEGYPQWTPPHQHHHTKKSK